MSCDKCGRVARCVDTRRKDGYRLRRYKCKCGNTYSSVEINIECKHSVTGIESLKESIVKEYLKKLMETL